MLEPESKLKRRAFMTGTGLALVGSGFALGRSLTGREAQNSASLPAGIDQEELAEMRQAPPKDPKEALERLVNGNRLFMAGFDEIGDQRKSLGHRLTLVGSQSPFALIIGCSDSRVAPELLFGAGLGDLFVVRVIGHVIDPAFASVVGSVEYGVHELKIPLVVVLGHEQCGAVKAAIRVVQEMIELPGAIDVVADAIRPTVLDVANLSGDIVANSVAANVRHGVKLLKTTVPLLDEPLRSGRVEIVGAVYELKTGAVSFIA